MQAISKSYLILLVIIIFNSFLSVAQITKQKSDKIGFGPNELLKKEVASTFLVGAERDLKKNNLPFLTHHISINNNGTIPTLILKNSVIRELSAKELEVISEFKIHITNDFESISSAATARFDNILYTSILPIRLNATTNKYEYLESYTTYWDYSISNKDVSTMPQQKKASSLVHASVSVLATGNWYKIGVTKNGIYKLDKTFLNNLGIDLLGVDPRNIRVYGNGGKLLKERNSQVKYDDLLENAVAVVGESDGVFDATDYVLFYGQSTNEWLRKVGNTIPYEHKTHDFSDTSFYFITTDLGLGKRLTTKNSLSNTPNKTTTTHDYYDIHEENVINMVKSGKEFYGEKFDFTTSYSFNFNIPEGAIGDSLYVKAAVLGRSDVVSNYAVNFNNGNFSVACPATSTSNFLADVGYLGTASKGGILGNSNLSVSITKTTAQATGWLDKIIINCRRNLIFNGNQFTFRDRKIIGGSGTFAQYNVTHNSSETAIIWDVTSPSNASLQNYNGAGANLNFTATADSLREYVMFTANSALAPKAYHKIANQNLHGVTQADFIIITHPLFMDEAKRIAKLHQDFDTLTYVIATTEQVYNEFSSGTPDIGAIREFTKMLYKRPADPTKAAQYLLLFGDGSYKNKDITNINNSAFIPTFQTNNSTSQTSSFVSDDYFAMMDDIEGEMVSGKVDVGVGRFCVRTKDESIAVTNKTEQYYKKNYGFDVNAMESSCETAANDYPQGDWRNKIVFVADDEDGITHIQSAELIASGVKNNYKNYNVDKIFADAYQQTSTPGGDRYLDMVVDINNSFENGCLIWNYTGHGGEVGLGSERFVDVPQILAWRNINNMPLMVTATCEFSRFDDPDRTSAGELCLLNEKGGAIGLMTTVRLAFSGLNETLNLNFFTHALAPMANGKMPHLGDLYRLTKQDLGFLDQFMNFVILGDPALKLAYPEQRIYTSTINSQSLSVTSSDTLRGLAKLTITGFVGDKLGNKLTTFNGVVFPTVFDKVDSLFTLRNDNDSGPFRFTQQKNVIYKGKSSVVNGDFTFTFLVPKDISFSFGKGKISYFAHNGVMDAQGYYDKVVVGGFNLNAIADNDGPQINLYMNDEKFINGGTTNESPKIFATISDSSGINTLGTGIGHDAVAILDATSSNPIVLNNYYVADLNTYQRGKIRYPFNELSEGKHTLSVKVWDVQNNSSTAFTDFIVSKEADLALTHILNYPNPFTTKTKFFIEHNQCCINLKVMIQVYTITGKVVKSINETINTEGFRTNGIEWDGKDDFGDKLARGVYIYRVSVSDGNKKKANKIEKLVILN